MKAVILLAGIGSRLHPLTLDKPKSLLPVGDATILQHMLTKLLKNGVDSFIIICGHMQEIIESYVQENFPTLPVRFVRNKHYLVTNTGYSLMLARPYLDGQSFIKLDGDVIFDEAIIQKLLATDDSASVVCVDHTAVNEEVIKVICHPNGDISRIGNRVSVAQAIGESIGIEKISAATATTLFDALERMMASEANWKYYYEVAYDQIIEAGARFSTVDISGLKWVEMDTQADYAQALREFAPT